MRNSVSPVVAAIVIAVVLVIAGFWMWKQTAGTTFSKSEARGDSTSGKGLPALGGGQ